jgi:hypothetical protein
MVTSRFPDYYRDVKITNLKCLIIAGSAALFLGLAGNARAIPIPVTGPLGSGPRFVSEQNSPGGFEITRALERVHEQFARSTPSVWLGLDLAHGAGQLDNRNWAGLPTGPAPGVVRQTCKEGAPAANVPEGGSTAILIGAALIGLAFVQKKLRA